MHNWLRKRPYVLCESCKRARDLQLWYSSVCPLQFNLLEFHLVKQGYSKCLAGARRSRPNRATPARHAVRSHRGPASWARHGRRGPTGATRRTQEGWAALHRRVFPTLGAPRVFPTPRRPPLATSPYSTAHAARAGVPCRDLAALAHKEASFPHRLVPTIKVFRPLASRDAEPVTAPPWVLPRWARCPAPIQCRLSTSSPSPHPPWACPLARWPGRPACSPKQGFLRPPPCNPAEPPSPALPKPVPATNQSRLGNPSSPAPSLTLSRRSLAGVRRIPPPAGLEDHIAKPQELPRSFVQTEGRYVSFSIFPRACVQNDSYPFECF
jgi:hypothetical protein